MRALLLSTTALILVFTAAARSARSEEVIAYAVGLDVSLTGAERGGIHIVRLDGSGLRQITFASTRNFNWEPHGLNLPDDHPSFSPDGRRIVFASNRANPSDWDIWIVNANGSDPRRLAPAAGLDTEPVFSPDGEKIAFASERFGNLDIVVMDASGENVTRLTSSPLEEIEPAWSPDGRFIAFTRVQGFDQKDVFIMRADGTGVRQLTTTGGEDHDPTFSPDGSRVAITTERLTSPPYGDIFVIRASDGLPDPAFGKNGNLTSDRPFGAGDPAWSHDGTRIAFFASSTAVITSPQELFVMDAKGGSKQHLPNQGLINIHPSWGIAVDTDLDGRPDYLENTNRSFDQRAFGDAASGFRFGSAIALADLTRDGILDLAVGVPGGTSDGSAGAGFVVLATGTELGPDPDASSPGVFGFLPQSVDAGFFGDAARSNGRFGQTLASGDLNGDGASDLVIGAPGQDSVYVLYSSIGPVQVLRGGSGFGEALAIGDFDHDGRRDLAVGAPRARRLRGAGAFVAGAVSVFRGTPQGLATVPLVFDQGDLGVAPDIGAEETGDEFGAALAAGDLDGDLNDDLAIGVPGEDIAGAADAGLVHVIRGKLETGLDLTTAVLRDGRSLPPPHEGLEPGARFGESLAFGDFNDDFFRLHDLAVGVPMKDVDGVPDSGLVAIYGGALASFGSLAANATVVTMADLDPAGGAGPGRLGSALATGDLSGDGTDDLAIAAPLATLNGRSGAGRIFLVFGVPAGGVSCTFCAPSPIPPFAGGGLAPASAQSIDQRSVGEAPETGDHFGGDVVARVGSVLTIADADGDGQGDLFAGVPEEDIFSSVDAGAVGIRYGIGVGVSTLSPRESFSLPGEAVEYTLEWEHHENWRVLASLHLRFVDGEGVLAWIRYDEGADRFRLLDSSTLRFGEEGVPGSTGVLANEWIELSLPESRAEGSGTGGRLLTLRLSIRPLPPLAGRRLRLEVLATDDRGNAQGFEEVGALTVLLPSGTGGQVPGDLTQDGRVDVSDAIALLGYLFTGTVRSLPCAGEITPRSSNERLLDANGSGRVDIADAVHLLGWLFLGGPPHSAGRTCLPLRGCPPACASAE